ncbi:glycosyl hydrolase [Labilibacter sediminis]|nr:glycosyl hydrolase [Labilibacter sediminis]
MNNIKALIIISFSILIIGKLYAQENKIEELVSQLTLEEKAQLCAGDGMWKTNGIERLGIPAIYMTDGPHGVRINDEANIMEPAEPATCFPTAPLVASTWDKDLIYKMGQALGKESQAMGVQMLLGPGVNIKRSPLGGRNFEYFSEDPYLSGKMAAGYINGVQSQGVGTSLKHYTVNNQEFERMLISAEVDERALREIYLPAFRIAIEESQPTSIMCAYNKVNEVYCSENKFLLRDILRDELGFEGLVVSDWGAVNDRVEGIKAGLDLQMPGDGGLNIKKIVEAVQNGSLEEKDLDRVVTNNLRIILQLAESKKAEAKVDHDEAHQLAKSIASQGTVLLKNEKAILPINKFKRQDVAVIGRFAKSPRYQGAGSSLVNPTRLERSLDLFQNLTDSKLRIKYAEGYNSKGDTNDELLAEAVAVAKKSDIVIVFAGLPDKYESEGFDRKNLDMPEGHNKLIEQVTGVSKKVIVVLQNGAPISMPWITKVEGVLESYLGGQAGGAATVDILLGNTNPSGKLAETFPASLSDTPAYLTWPGEGGKTHYGEGVFVGYRYYDKKNIEPLFPFGYGLSYTTFEYSDLVLDKTEINETESIQLTCKVTNSGEYDGKEIVQLYVRDIESDVVRPVKELKGFEKITLDKGEQKTVQFSLQPSDFQYYSTAYDCWKADSGEFDILIGSSSRDIHLTQRIKLTVNKKYWPHYDLHSTLKEIQSHPAGKRFVDGLIKQSMAMYNAEGLTEDQIENAEKQKQMMQRTLMEMPIGKLIQLSGGQMPERGIQRLIDKINRKIKEENEK